MPLNPFRDTFPTWISNTPHNLTALSYHVTERNMQADNPEEEQDFVKSFDLVYEWSWPEKENTDKNGGKGLNSPCTVLFFRLYRFMGVH